MLFPFVSSCINFVNSFYSHAIQFDSNLVSQYDKTHSESSKMDSLTRLSIPRPHYTGLKPGHANSSQLYDTNPQSS